jgi:NitT/TauT family transport system permease protein
MSAPTLDRPVASDRPSAVRQRRPRRSRLWSRTGWAAAQLALLVALIWLWQKATERGSLNPFFIGQPSLVWDYLKQWYEDGTLWHNSWATLSIALLGWVIGTLAGTVLGVALGVLPTARAVLDPYLALLNGMPRIVFYPLFAVALGYSATSRVLLVVFVIIVLVTLNVIAGMRSVSPDLLNHVRIVGGRTPVLVRQVYLPSLSLWILGSSRLTLGLALQAAIVAEFVGPTSGLGYLAVLGQARFDINLTLASVTVMVVVGLVLDSVLQGVERWTSRWKG